MRLTTFAIKKSYKIFLSVFFFIELSIFVVLCIPYVYSQPNSYYDEEIELEYGVPTQLSEVTVPSSNIFESHGIPGFSLQANFSNNSGSIWINDINNETLWVEQLNQTIDIYIKVNNTSIRQYSLWVNSSTIGNNTLYYTFKPDIIHAGNFGIIIAIFVIPAIIIIGIIYGIAKKKPSRSVKFATRIGEKMATKLNKIHREIKQKLCPKCGLFIEKSEDKYCTECGFELRK